MPATKAIRYTEDNLEEVLNFSPQGEIIYAGDASALRGLIMGAAADDSQDTEKKAVHVYTPRGRKVLAVGEWVALDDEGSYHVLDDECFEGAHRVVDGERSA